MRAKKPAAESAAEGTAHPAANAHWGGRFDSPAAQRALKEEVILDCAARWFHRHGFHGASLSDIAGELGVTKAAIYHYARNKEELLYKLHVRSLMAARAARDEAVAQGGSGLDRVAGLVHNVAMVMTGSPMQTFVLLEPDTLSADHAREIAAARRWLMHDLRDLVAQGVADGSIAKRDPDLAAFAIVGAQNWIGRWFRPEGSLSREHIAAEYEAITRDMLASRPGH